MKKPLLCAALLAALTMAPAFSDMFHDRTDPDATGGITGRAIGGILKDAIAIEQTAYKFYQGSVGGDTYSFTNIPPGKYDLLLKLEEDVIEGLRLDIWGEVEEISREDHKAITKLIDISDDFFHDKKIIRKNGTEKKQKLIVEQIRTKTIFNPDGSIAQGKMIRRFDYIVLRKTRDVWQIEKCRNVFRELRSKTGKGSVLEWHYDPTLGGIRVADEIVTVEDVKLKRRKKNKER